MAYNLPIDWLHLGRGYWHRLSVASNKPLVATDTDQSPLTIQTSIGGNKKPPVTIANNRVIGDSKKPPVTVDTDRVTGIGSNKPPATMDADHYSSSVINDAKMATWEFTESNHGYYSYIHLLLQSMRSHDKFHIQGGLCIYVANNQSQ